MLQRIVPIKSAIGVLSLCMLTLLGNGCGKRTAQTNAQGLRGAIATTDWSFEVTGTRTEMTDEWIHIPADEAAELLIWIEHMENNQ